MKRKNLIAIKKVKKNKLLIKDTKILNYYKKFKSIIFNNIKEKSFAVAVSGGPDSLCLAYFSKIYSSEFSNKIHVLIVDHKLRKESGKETLKVKEILKKRKILSRILSWKGKSPKNNIQKKNFIIVIGDFYYLDSANNLKLELQKETKINNFLVKKIKDNQFRLQVGPFKNFSTLKSAYISLNNLGFEGLNIYQE